MKTGEKTGRLAESPIAWAMRGGNPLDWLDMRDPMQFGVLRRTGQMGGIGTAREWKRSDLGALTPGDLVIFPMTGKAGQARGALMARLTSDYDVGGFMAFLAVGGYLPCPDGQHDFRDGPAICFSLGGKAMTPRKPMPMNVHSMLAMAREAAELGPIVSLGATI